jgi:phage/plasmid-like protein (TIGR03299 family)
MSESILDDILARHEGPKVVRSEHDLSKIAVGEGNTGKPSDSLRRQIASIRRGGWDAAEYGISAEAQVAKLEVALAEAVAYEATPEGMEAARIAAEKALEEMRSRAIRRAGLDVSGGKVSVMTVVGPNGEKLPWHVLGTMVADAVSSEDAERLANITWDILKLPARYTVAGKEYVSKDTFVLVREDTGMELGSTGNKYQPIQNSTGFKFLDSVLEEVGARYETAGAIYGGKKVWMQARLPNLTFEVQKGDVNEVFATFILDHTGGGCDVAFSTVQRVVCANTMRMANGDKSKGVRIRHTGDVMAKVADAQQAFGLTVKRAEKYKEAAQEMVKTPLAIEPYASDVLDAVMEVTAAQSMLGADVLAAAIAKMDANRQLLEKQFQRQIDARENVLQDILERYESDRCEPKGTAWSALQAVAESADWHVEGKRKKEYKADRQLESIVAGEADEMKQIGYQLAYAAVK